MAGRSEVPQNAGPDRLSVGKLAVAFLSILMLSQFFPQAAAGLLFADRDAGMQMLVRLMYPPFYALIIVLSLPRFGDIIGTAARHWLPSVGVLLCATSVLWSVEPGVSGRRAVLLVCTTLFSIYLTIHFELRNILRVLATGILTILIASALATPLIPDLTIGSDANGFYFQGLFEHRNGLGGLMVLGIFSVIGLALIERPKWSGGRMLALALMVGALILTRSITSIIAVGIIFILYMAIEDRTLAIRFGLVVGGAMLTGALLLVPERFFDVLGKDMSLTGRTVLWAWVIERIGEAPLSGYGYSALFYHLGLESEKVELLPKIQMPHPHNGYLSAWLDAGLPLVLIAIGILVRLFQNSMALMRMGLPYGAVGVIFGVVFALYNVSEITLFQFNELMWVLFLVIYVKVAAMRAYSAPAPRVGGGPPRAASELGATSLTQSPPRFPVSAR
jgi:exopolysaccharide production protein ExoQ